MGFIYKISNSINNKIYIGQTRRTVEERWKEHIYNAYKRKRGQNSCFHTAIRQFGSDAFIAEAIEQCEDKDLDEREVYWISYYSSNSPENGYNSASGGYGGWSKCPDEPILKKWSEGKTIKEIAEELSICTDAVSARLKSLGISKEEISCRHYKKRTKKIYQYDLQGNFIAEFPSLIEAEKSIGRHLFFSPNNKELQVCGFQWRRYKADRIDPLKSIKEPKHVLTIDNHKCKPVHKYTISGEYICSYSSIAEAVLDLPTMGDRSNISNACAGRTRHAHGFRWSFDKVDKLPEMKELKSAKQVAVLNDSGEIIEIYPSTFKASFALNVSRSVISRACTGTKRKCGGYYLKYV